jgi:hypothetical protein
METSSKTDTAALIDVTEQRSRLYFGGAAFGLSFVLVVAAPFLLTHDFAIAALASFGIGSLTMFASGLFVIRTLRCPNCQLPLLQHAFGEVPYGTWLSWLLTTKSCPGRRSAHVDGLTYV